MSSWNDVVLSCTIVDLKNRFNQWPSTKALLHVTISSTMLHSQHHTILGFQPMAIHQSPTTCDDYFNNAAFPTPHYPWFFQLLGWNCLPLGANKNDQTFKSHSIVPLNFHMFFLTQFCVKPYVPRRDPSNRRPNVVVVVEITLVTLILSGITRTVACSEFQVLSDCSQDQIIFVNFEDQTCSRIEVRLETVKDVGTCPIKKAVGQIDSRADEGMDQGMDSRWRECRTVRIWQSW